MSGDEEDENPDATMRLSVTTDGAAEGERVNLTVTLWLGGGHLDFTVTPVAPAPGEMFETIAHLPPAEARALSRFFRMAERAAAAYRRENG